MHNLVISLRKSFTCLGKNRRTNPSWRVLGLSRLIWWPVFLFVSCNRKRTVRSYVSEFRIKPTKKKLQNKPGGFLHRKQDFPGFLTLLSWVCSVTICQQSQGKLILPPTSIFHSRECFSSISVEQCQLTQPTLYLPQHAIRHTHTGLSNTHALCHKSGICDGQCYLYYLYFKADCITVGTEILSMSPRSSFSLLPIHHDFIILYLMIYLFMTRMIH